MNLERLQELLACIGYGKFRFYAIEDKGHLFIQGRFDAPDFRTGEPYENVTRMWFMSPHATFSEVVKTVWLLVSQAEEHERRENFVVLDAAGNRCRPFNPHMSIEELSRVTKVEYSLYAEKNAEEMSV